MIYLILDILFYSLTPLNTSFYLYYLTYHKDYLNILSLIIIIYLPKNKDFILLKNRPYLQILFSVPTGIRCRGIFSVSCQTAV